MGSSPAGRLEIHPVASAAEMRQFVALPYALCGAEPLWVPPLRTDVRWTLSERDNPFWRHARRRLFLVRRGSQFVGRVAAIVDDAHNRVHEERTGFFGFFECADDAETGPALLDAASDWLRAEGMTEVRGPVNPSMNDECGFLVEGHDESPAILMPYTPSRYLEAAASAGFAKARDLLAYVGDVHGEAEKRLERLAAALRRRNPDIVVRPLDPSHFARDLALFKEIYNGAWKRNWGFVPLDDAEIDAMAKRLKPLVVPELVLFAEVRGEPAGAIFSLPDYNQALRGLRDGRLFPFGLLRFLAARRHIDQARCLTMGVLDAFRGRGVDALLMLESLRAAARLGHRRGELSWILEDNEPMNRLATGLGTRVYKRYRIVSRPLEAATAR